MAEIKHDITVNATRETIYTALTTAQGLAAWFTATVTGSGKVGSEWQLEFKGEPSFRWKILTSESPSKVVWQCIAGPGHAPGTEVEFNLKAAGDKKATLTIVHRGWSKDDPKFDRCVDIWRTLMNHLQRYCEQDITEPVYQ